MRHQTLLEVIEILPCRCCPTRLGKRGQAWKRRLLHLIAVVPLASYRMFSAA